MAGHLIPLERPAYAVPEQLDQPRMLGSESVKAIELKVLSVVGIRLRLVADEDAPATVPCVLRLLAVEIAGFSKRRKYTAAGSGCRRRCPC